MANSLTYLFYVNIMFFFSKNKQLILKVNTYNKNYIFYMDK